MKAFAAGGLVTALLGAAPALALPAPGGALQADWCTPPQVLRETARDDFADDGGAQQRWRWRLEAQQPGTQVQVGSARVLDLQTPAGASLWWHAELQGNYELRFQARALPAPDSAGALAGRVSDLNLFWNATEADGSAPRPRDGAFASNDTLRAYYLGFGANSNRTTRLRHYDGQGRRTVLDGWADAPEATPEDRQGPMTPAARLEAGRWVQVRVVSHAPRAALEAAASAGVHGEVHVDGRRLFTLAQPQALLRGWFALRTTASRLQVRQFQVLHCMPP